MGKLADRLGLSHSSQFLAKVTVVELSQVPLVNAKFRIKWKFKGATSANGLLDGDSGADDASRRYLHPLSATQPRARRNSFGTSPARRTDSPHRDSEAEDSGHETRPRSEYATSQSPPMSPGQTPNPNKTPSASQFAVPQFTSPFASLDSKDSGALLSSSHSADESGALVGGRRGAAMTPIPMHHAPRTEPKGMTTFIPLRAHTATFKRDLQCPVSIPLKSMSGGRYQLQSSALKLSIRQEVLGDEGKREEAKMGEVILDLSQFVGHGKSDARRYLLRESKTNATLKVSVQMEWIGGESEYVAPPLKSGQVKNASPSSSIASTPSMNRSTTSVNSRNSNTKPSFAAMSRTNSSSSVSVHSVPSTRSSVPSIQTRGWHPPSHSSNFSTSPSPNLLGGSTTNGSGIEKSAQDVIDAIFNRPARQNSHGGFHQPLANGKPVQRTGSASRQNSGDSSLSFTVGGRKRQATVTKDENVGPLSKGKGKDTDKEGWFKIALPVGSPPPQPTRAPPSATTIRPNLTRQVSSSSTTSRTRSVRWEDGEGPRKGDESASLKNLDSAMSSTSPGPREGVDEMLGARKTGFSHMSMVATSALAEKERELQNAPPPKGKVVPTGTPSKQSSASSAASTGSKGGIVWGDSWAKNYSYLVFVNSIQPFFLTNYLQPPVPTEKLGSVTGTLILADEILSFFLVFVWGAIADLITVRYVVSVGHLIVALAFLLYPESTTVYPGVLLSRLAFAVGASGLVTALGAALASMTAIPVADSSVAAAPVPARAPTPEPPRISVTRASTTTVPRDSSETDPADRTTLLPLERVESPEEDLGPADPKNSARFAGILGTASGVGALMGVFVFLRIPDFFTSWSNKASIRAAFYIVSVIALCEGVFLVAGLKGKAMPAAGVRAEEGTVAEDQSSKGFDWRARLNALVMELPRGIKIAAAEPDIALAMFSSFTIRAQALVVTAFFPLYINHYYLLHDCPSPCRPALILSASLTGVIQLLSLLLSPVVGFLIPRITPQLTLLFSSLLGVVSFLVFSFLPNGGDPTSGRVWAAGMAAGASQIGGIVVGLALVAEGRARLMSRSGEQAKEIGGAISGVYSAAGGLGILLVGKIGGTLFDKWPSSPFFIIAMLDILVAVAALAVYLRGGKIEI